MSRSLVKKKHRKANKRVRTKLKNQKPETVLEDDQPETKKD